MAKPAFTVAIEGDKKLRKKLRPSLYEPALTMALEDASVIGMRKAMTEAPRDTGALKRSIVHRITYPSARVFSQLDYAWYVEHGTKGPYRRNPPVSALRGWARRHNWNVFALVRVIGRFGTDEQPFMSPARDVVSQRLPDLLEEASKRIAKKWKR